MVKFTIFSIFLTFALFGCTFGQTDEPGAIWIPSPHKSSRNGYSVKWLIVHGTAGGSSAQAIGQWFQNPDSQAATHYVVGRDGAVVQCVRESEAAWGNGRIETGADSWWVSPNAQTISIENVKPSTDNSDHISEAQKNAIFNLIRNIISRYPAIQLRWADGNGGITGHFSMSPASRARCPGPFPWEDLFAFLNNRNPEPPCTGIVDTTTVLNVRVLPRTSAAVQGTANPGSRLTFYRRVEGDSVSGNTFFSGIAYPILIVLAITIHAFQIFSLVFSVNPFQSEMEGYAQQRRQDFGMELYKFMDEHGLYDALASILFFIYPARFILALALVWGIKKKNSTVMLTWVIYMILEQSILVTCLNIFGCIFTSSINVLVCKIIWDLTCYTYHILWIWQVIIYLGIIKKDAKIAQEVYPGKLYPMMENKFQNFRDLRYS